MREAYVPGSHTLQAGRPSVEEYVPMEHSTQTLESFAPSWLEKRPVRQSTHDADDGAATFAEKLPPEQSLQASELFDPITEEYDPE